MRLFRTALTLGLITAPLACSDGSVGPPTEPEADAAGERAAVLAEFRAAFYAYQAIYCVEATTENCDAFTRTVETVVSGYAEGLFSRHDQDGVASGHIGTLAHSTTECAGWNENQCLKIYGAIELLGELDGACEFAGFALEELFFDGYIQPGYGLSGDGYGHPEEGIKLETTYVDSAEVYDISGLLAHELLHVLGATHEYEGAEDGITEYGDYCEGLAQEEYYH